jgi:hypothetical protein
LIAFVLTAGGGFFIAFQSQLKSHRQDECEVIATIKVKPLCPSKANTHGFYVEQVQIQ